MEAEVINKAKEIKMVDKRLSQIPGKELQLHLEIENAQLKAHLFHTTENEILAFHSTSLSNDYYEFDDSLLTNFLTTSPLVQHINVSKTSVSIVSQKYTLIPNVLFNKEKALNVLSVNCAVNENDTVLYKSINFLDATAVFAFPNLLKEIINAHLNNVEYIPHVAPTYLSIHNLFKSEKENLLFINVHSDYYDIVFFDQGQLKLFTTHTIETTEDFLYYSFYTLEQMKSSSANTQVYLTGEVEKNSAIHEILMKYFKKSSWILKSSPYKIGYDLNDINPYFYFSHFSQYLCV